jgi:hypothetical protein
VVGSKQYFPTKNSDLIVVMVINICLKNLVVLGKCLCFRSKEYISIKREILMS